jgi:hypothetical protein
MRRSPFDAEEHHVVPGIREAMCQAGSGSVVVPGKVGVPPAVVVVEPGRELRENPVVDRPDKAPQLLSWTSGEAMHRPLEEVAILAWDTAALGDTAAV